VPQLTNNVIFVMTVILSELNYRGLYLYSVADPGLY